MAPLRGGGILKEFLYKIYFFTRKYVDFIHCAIILLIKFNGLDIYPEGKDIVNRLSNNTNRDRYTNNQNKTWSIPTQKEIDKLFKKKKKTGDNLSHNLNK